MRWLILAGLLLGCTDEENSRRALEAEGFSDITFTGYKPFACGKEDLHTGFIATNVKGKRVEGTVCCGWLKYCTIRF